MGSGLKVAFLASQRPVAQQLTAKAVPSWCQYVPTSVQSAACRGSTSGCTCSSFCKDTPAASRSNNPECCGCDATQAALSDGKASGSKVAFLASQQPAAQHLTAKAVPSWCQ